MNNFASTSTHNAAGFEDDEIFEDSSIMANFNNSSFKETTARPPESNMNHSFNRSDLNVSALCCDEEINGYDKITGRTWIYPTNFPVRDYQFNIINAALLKNTLVSLPTGLGKTFIAAVIMYNYYRWYPLGKILFTAPTRPLVAQQIDACYSVVAIPPSDTVEMTGHMQATTRKTHWQSKRVFFATPQVIYNDIKAGICPGDKIRCLVIDEAHRARGNYAYCQIVGALSDMGHKTYRVLALSATPGSKVEDVVNVVKNLNIAHLELRTEGCIDVAPYSHARRINTVIIQLGPELTQLRQRYVEILDGYARSLKELNILPHNLGNLSKGRIVMLYKEFQNKDRANRHPRHSYIMKDFTVLIALFHGLELLTRHGSRVFLNFFDEHPEKGWIQADNNLTSLLERLRDDLGVNPLSLNRSILPDGTIPEVPQNLCFGHPKFIRLKEIMMDHFTRAKENKQDTRAIVFCEYRESVNLVHCLLLQCRPLITPQMFVGQGASGKDGKTMISQKGQLRVMRSFREGGCNALVATCVAEEGLDVGSVDLILCFDISTRSPIRLVQRCGRTGRERGGQVHILVTEGREHQTLMDCMRQRDGLNKKILQSREVQAALYALNPRMLPRDLTPRCQKMYLTVAKRDANEKGTTEKANKKGQKDLRTMLLGRASSSSSSSSNKELESNPIITEEEFKEIFPEGYRITNFLVDPEEYWAKSKETIKSLSKSEEPGKLKLSTWLEWQRTLQKTVNVGHSKDTEIMASLLQCSDAKRFEMPASTQNPSFNTQDFATQNIIAIPSPAKVSSPVKTKQPKKRAKVPLIKSPGKRDGDIRALFSTATKSTKNYTKFISDLGVQNDGTIPTRLINLLVDLSLENTNTARTCYICQNICECSLMQNMRKSKKPSMLNFIKEPKFPDIDLIDDIDAETIIKCAKNANGSDDLVSRCNNDISYLNVDNKNNCSRNFDLEFDFDSPIDLTSPEKVEKGEMLDKGKGFDIGDIEDIFADSSPEEAVAEVVETKDRNSSDPKDVLGFFGLNSIDDIFAESDDSIDNKTSKTPQKINKKEANVKVVINPANADREGSPSILSGRQKTIPTSPILCTQVRKFKLSTNKNLPQSSTPNSNTRRQLITDTSNNNDIIWKSKENIQSKSSLIQNSLADTSNKSMFTITQLVNIINKTDQEKSTLSKCNTSKQVDKHIGVIEDEKSTSPILLTQADRKKTSNHLNESKSKTNSTTGSNKPAIVSLIILESDSDSENNTQVYDMDEKYSEITNNEGNITEPLSTPERINNNFKMLNYTNETNTTGPYKSPVNTKRKLQIEDDDDTINNSPYFNKKQKLNDNTSKALTIQEKVLAALTSSKINKGTFNNDTNINFVFTPPASVLKTQKSPRQSQKENENPQNISDDEQEYVRKRNLEMLQMFRRDSKIDSPKRKFDLFINSQAKTQIAKRSLTFDDSDDDFMDNKKNDDREQKAVNDKHRNRTITNHKVRKKKRKGNEFLELEAELSDDGRDSGDELSDDSIGSIIDFICDENVTHHEDMQAHYMRSVKSPVKGVFKIPHLPNRHNNTDVFSQYVEEDNYEMDSFCVDSHIGLTQVNDESELELAEMLLETRKKIKERARPDSPRSNDGSPLVRRKNRNLKRLIHSDSEDSS